MEYAILIGVVFAIGMGFSMTIDQNPCLCKTLKVKYILKEKSILRCIFPSKEHRGHPYSFLRIIPLFVSYILLIIVIPLYLVYFIGVNDFVNSLVESRLSLIFGFSIIAIYFLYPLFLILFNKIFELREKIMDMEKKKELETKYEKYYKKLD